MYILLSLPEIGAGLSRCRFLHFEPWLSIRKRAFMESSAYHVLHHHSEAMGKVLASVSTWNMLSWHAYDTSSSQDRSIWSPSPPSPCPLFLLFSVVGTGQKTSSMLNTYSTVELLLWLVCLDPWTSLANTILVVILMSFKMIFLKQSDTGPSFSISHYPFMFPGVTDPLRSSIHAKHAPELGEKQLL